MTGRGENTPVEHLTREQGIGNGKRERIGETICARRRNNEVFS